MNKQCPLIVHKKSSVFCLPRRTLGISLLEIMIVLAVIALIMGLVAPRVIGYFGRAKSQTAQIQMTHIKGALQLMYIDLGRYPSEAEGLAPAASGMTPTLACNT